MTLSRNGIPSSPWMRNTLSTAALVLSARSWLRGASSSVVEIFSKLRHCPSLLLVETVSKRRWRKLLDDRKSQKVLRHGSEYDKLGQDLGYATLLSGPWPVSMSLLKSSWNTCCQLKMLSALLWLNNLALLSAAARGRLGLASERTDRTRAL